MIFIPSNYYEGRDTLTLEYPWTTPESITWLDDNLRFSMSVVEFGCGGSTIFLGRRCGHVLSMDNNPNWIKETKKAITDKGLDDRILLLSVTSIEECKNAANHKYDVAFIDCCDISRYELAVYMHDRANIVVIDNYAAAYVGDTDAIYNDGWDIYIFDDLHWQGRGTKIYQRRLS
jgi:predicted O-methyltransferase YrrM